MATFKLDPMHSEVHFKITHLMISTVSGSFSKFDATMESALPDFSDAKVHFDIETSSISTNNEQRDVHLKSPDFFDVAKYPKITFESTNIKKYNDKSLLLTGNLTMHGVTNAVTFTIDFHGTMKDGYGQVKSGFDAEGKLNRSKFGLVWNAPTETGGFLVSDEVKLQLSVQMVKQA